MYILILKMGKYRRFYGLGIINEAGNILMPKWIKESLRPNNIGKGIWDKKIAGELAEQSKFYSKAGKVLEKAGYVGVGIDVGIGIYNNVQEGTCWQRIVTDAFVDFTISMFILLAASAIAAILISGIGAVIGAVIGLLGGSPVSSVVGAGLVSGISTAILSILIAYGLNWIFNDWEIYNGKSISGNIKESIWAAINSLTDIWGNVSNCCN